jgi:hypothetical protein
MEITPFPIRLSLLAAVLLTLGVIGIRVLGYPPLLSLPGSTTLIGGAVFLLFCYGVAMVWPPNRRDCPLRLQFATMLGAVGGLIQVIHLLVERFSSVSQPWNGIVTLAFMLVTFLVWGFVGYRARERGLSLGASCLAAVWSAMATMTIAVLAGTLLEFYIAPIPLEDMKAWAEFQRSGWNDLAAFSIANTLDETSTHLIVGPVVACLFGALGYCLSRLTRKSAT